MLAGSDVSEQFTKIPNRILDALCLTRLPGEVGQILMAIVRQTYGWHKDEDKISLSQFHKKTGIYPPNVHRALSVLEGMKIIITDRTPGRTTLHRINLDTEAWRRNQNREQINGELLSVLIIALNCYQFR